MTYDFTTLIPRGGMDALALEPEKHFAHLPPLREGYDYIPMWVADMSFPTVPAIQTEIIRRAQHPCFGYFTPREEYYAAIRSWQERRNGVTDLQQRQIGFENGVLGGVVSALNACCVRGDYVLLHSPTYIGFTGTLENNGYRILLSPLRPDAEGRFRMDFADMESLLKAYPIRAMVFCSPHNPSGRVWERAELEELMALMERYAVTVISDEIWSDLVLPGFRHIPLQSVSPYAREHTVALYAPSKTFNLAGIAGAYHIIYQSALRRRVEKEASLSHYNNMNLLSMYALIGAYSDAGADWLEQLLRVLAENVRFAADALRSAFPGVRLTEPEGTYMLFPDFSEYLDARKTTLDRLLAEGWSRGVLWQDGRPFHGASHIRLNLALPHARLREAMGRLAEIES